GVDPQSRERIWEMLDKLKQAGASLVLTTHQLDEAQTRGDRIVIIDHGKTTAAGTFPRACRTDHRHASSSDTDPGPCAAASARRSHDGVRRADGPFAGCGRGGGIAASAGACASGRLPR